MNKAQRKRLDDVVTDLSALIDTDDIQKDALKERLESAESEISEIIDEEREKFDNMNEGLQNSATGQAISDAADNLENISWPLASDIDNTDWKDEEEMAELHDSIQSVIDELENI